MVVPPSILHRAVDAEILPHEDAVAEALREPPNFVNTVLTAGLVAGETPFECAATECTPEFIMHSVTVVLVDRYPQLPTCQRPVA